MAAYRYPDTTHLFVVSIYTSIHCPGLTILDFRMGKQGIKERKRKLGV
jgi:hypothetical protein